MLLQFKFTIGRNEVIKGWEEGILGMQAGGERLLIVPPKLGYGSRKMDGIPANSTLRFGMLLLNISAKIIQLKCMIPAYTQDKMPYLHFNCMVRNTVKTNFKKVPIMDLLKWKDPYIS